MIIKDRATIYQALAEQLCNRCAYGITEYYCEYDDQVFEDEKDNCLVNIVLNNLGDWDWPDSADIIREVATKEETV